MTSMSRSGPPPRAAAVRKPARFSRETTLAYVLQQWGGMSANTFKMMNVVSVVTTELGMDEKRGVAVPRTHYALTLACGHTVERELLGAPAPSRARCSCCVK